MLPMRHTIVTWFSFAIAARSCAELVVASSERVEKILSKMSLEEKIGQMAQVDMNNLLVENKENGTQSVSPVSFTSRNFFI